MLVFCLLLIIDCCKKKKTTFDRRSNIYTFKKTREVIYKYSQKKQSDRGLFRHHPSKRLITQPAFIDGELAGL